MLSDSPLPVMKVRIRNSDIQKGKSGGYRLIYWISSTKLIVLLDIYSKSDREDIEIDEIRQIITGFSTLMKKQMLESFRFNPTSKLGGGKLSNFINSYLYQIR